MAIDLQDIAIGSILRTALNNRLAKIKAYLDSIPGGALIAGSVTLDRLAKQRAVFSFDSRVEDLSGHANNDILDGIRLPNLDSASYSGWQLYSYSAFARVASGATSNYLRLKKGASTIFDVDLGSVSAGTPMQGNITAANQSATNDAWTIVYLKSGTPTLTDVSLRLFFSAQLIANY